MRRSADFYKTLLVILVLSILPAGIMGGRLIVLNRQLLQRGSSTWTLPDDAVIRITRILIDQAAVFLVLSLILAGIAIILVLQREIKAAHKLQQVLADYQKGQVDQPGNSQSNTVIENLATSFSQLLTQVDQLKHFLDVDRLEFSQRHDNLSKRLALLAQIAREIASSSEPQVLLNSIAKQILQQLEVYYVGIYSIDDHHEYVVLVAGTGEAGKTQLQRNHSVKIGEMSVVGQVAAQGELRIVNDLGADYLFHPDTSLPQTRSEAVLPLNTEAGLIGVLDVHSAFPDCFSDELVKFLQSLADQISIALLTTRLESKLTRQSQEIEDLSRHTLFGSWIGAPGSDQPVGYQYDGAQVSPLRPDFQVEHTDLSGRNLEIVDTYSEASKTKKSTILVPLQIYDQLIGVIGVENDNPVHVWTQSEITLIEAVANQVALALDNTRLLEETQKRADQLRLLQEITSAAASHIAVGELLDDIARRICSGYQLLYCGIALLDPDGRQATLMGTAFDHDIAAPILTGTKIKYLPTDFLAKVIRTKNYYVIDHLQDDSQGADAETYLKEIGANSLILLPLVLRGDVIGLIMLASKSLEWKMTEDDLRLLRQISLQTANAIDIARSFERAAQRADMEKMMIGIMTRMRETLDVEMVLQTAVNEIFNAFNLEKVACYLVPEQHGELENGAAQSSILRLPENKELT